MKNVEVLAPAGNYQSFLSAINNGADAVYLGLNDFNARGNLENFTVENIENVVRKAHLFGVKVYLAINILFQDSEIEEAISLVRSSINAKVDAFIVQDIGLAYLLANTFEGIELHASTQMGLQNLEGVEFVKKIGYSRVVLARETPLNEIKRINENCEIEIEYFVQGALCVSFSGNCYMCSLRANASGNRGKCKQFCRLPYDLKEKGKRIKEGYLLSTKDFCNLPNLKEMVECGVTSLKIEGRARRPAYVGGAVQVYRNAVDNDFNFNENDIQKLQKLYNRGGFISGYFKEEKIINHHIQNHTGVKIGEVVSVKKGKKFNEITVLSKHNIVKGDSLKFFDFEKEIASVNVQDVKKVTKDKYMFTTTTLVPLGVQVNLIVDSNLEHEILTNKKKIDLTARIEAKIGKKAILYMRADGQTAKIEGEEILEESRTQPLTHEECFSQISKLGEDFVLKNLECDLENIFMRKSTLNELRRQCLLLLEEKIIKSHEKSQKIHEKIFKISQNSKNGLNKRSIFIFDDLSKILEDFNNIDYFVFSPNKYNKNDIINFCKTNLDKTIYLDMPVIVSRGDIELFKDIFANCPNLGVYATNYYCFSLATPEKTILSPEMNVFNSFSIDFYIKNGYKKIVLSKENFNFSKINIQDAEIFMLASIKHKYMYFKHCPIKEHIGGNCASCKFKEDIEYNLGNKTFKLKRKKAVTCQFYLEDKAIENRQINEKFGKVIEKI